MTNYTRGASFERRVRAQYEREGYFLIRSAGSKGKADLVAIQKVPIPTPPDAFLQHYAPEVLLIQCKIRASRKPFLNLEIREEKIVSMPKEARELKALAESVGARAIWAIRKGRRGMELIEL